MLSKCHFSFSKENKKPVEWESVLGRGPKVRRAQVAGTLGRARPLWFGPCPPQRASTHPAGSGPGLRGWRGGHEALSRFDLARWLLRRDVQGLSPTGQASRGTCCRGTAWALCGQCGSSLGCPGKTGRGRRGLGCSRGFQSPPSRVWLEGPGGQVRVAPLGGDRAEGDRAGGALWEEGQWQGTPVTPGGSCLPRSLLSLGPGGTWRKAAQSRPAVPTLPLARVCCLMKDGLGRAPAHTGPRLLPLAGQPSRGAHRTRVECVYVHVRVQTALLGADACLRVCTDSVCVHEQ